MDGDSWFKENISLSLAGELFFFHHWNVCARVSQLIWPRLSYVRSSKSNPSVSNPHLGGML